MLIFAFMFLFPFYDMFMGSFMQDSDLFSRTPRFWPVNGFDGRSYVTLFRDMGYARPLFNSLVLVEGVYGRPLRKNELVESVRSANG